MKKRYIRNFHIHFCPFKYHIYFLLSNFLNYFRDNIINNRTTL